MQDRNPIIVISIVQAVPVKVAPAVLIRGKAKKEGRPIEPVFRAELC